MNYTTKSFENSLLKKGVVIDNIKKPKGIITEVTGTIGTDRLKWNKAGKCCQGNKRVREYDVNFKNDSTC